MDAWRECACGGEAAAVSAESQARQGRKLAAALHHKVTADTVGIEHRALAAQGEMLAGHDNWGAEDVSAWRQVDVDFGLVPDEG